MAIEVKTGSALIKELTDGFSAAKNSFSSIQERRLRNFNLYTGRSTKRKYKSESNFHVPYIATLLDNVWPLLVARLPQSVVAARNFERDNEAASLMEELIKYTFDVTDFEYKFIMAVKDAMMYDTGWKKVIWKWQDKETDHPMIEHLDPFNVFTHPSKVYLDDPWPIYQRAEMTKEQMLEAGYDKKLVNKLSKSKLENDTYRKQRLQSLGLNVTDPEKDDLYEVVESWCKKRTEAGEMKVYWYVLANGETLLNETPVPGKKPYESPYDHGYYPFIWLPYSPLSHSMLSESFIDPVASQQEELNALENMKADNYKRRNNPPLKIRRESNVDLTTLQFVNAAPWVVERMDDIEMMLLPDLAASIESQQNMIRAQMQARTGANDVLLVAEDVQIKGGDTATGASIADQNTKMRFRPQALIIDFAMKRIGDIIIALYQDKRFFDREKAITIADEEGEYYEREIKPQDIQDDLQFIVTSASSLAESRDVQLAKYINLKTLYAEDPSIDHEEFDKKIFEAANLDYNKVKKDKETGVQELAGKLKQLVMLTRSPRFASLPEPQKAQILTQIQKIKEMLGGGMSEEMMNQEAMPEENAQPPATATA